MKSFLIVVWLLGRALKPNGGKGTIPRNSTTHVLIPFFGHWEGTRYISCRSCKRWTDVLWLHRSSRLNLRSFNRRTGPTLLAPALDVFPAKDPVESLPNFGKRLVCSIMSTRTSIVHFLKYFLGSNGRNHQLHSDMPSIRTLPGSLNQSFPDLQGVPLSS